MKPANYTVEKTVDGWSRWSELSGRRAAPAEMAIAVSVGNMAYRFRSGGEDILWFPYASPAELKAKPAFCGIPFLAPWANRLDGDAYWANGKRYLLNSKLGNLRRDAHQQPIHGLLNFSPYWELADRPARTKIPPGATSRLEFARHPDLMAQFPFAHTVVDDPSTERRRARSGDLDRESRCRTAARGGRPSPLFLPAGRSARPVDSAPGRPRSSGMLNDMLIPTGERRPVEFSDPYPLKGAVLDDVFGEPGPRSRWPRTFLGGRRRPADHRDLRSEVHRGDRLRPRGARISSASSPCPPSPMPSTWRTPASTGNYRAWRRAKSGGKVSGWNSRGRRRNNAPAELRSPPGRL